MNEHTERRGRQPMTPESFLARIRATLAELEPRTNYRAPVAQLVFAVQVAARSGFPLQVVAAGGIWATFALSAEELAVLVDAHLSLQLDN